MRPTHALFLLLAALPGAAPALSPEIHDGLYLSEAGVEYERVEGLAGVVLRSRAPVTHHVGAAAAARMGLETLSFGRGCAVTSSLLGEGGWSGDADGFGAWFPGPAAVTFPGQHLAGLHDVCRRE